MIEASVLSTPGMISMMEGSATALAYQLEERKLRFDVEVTEGERTIGIGTHERRVVETDRLGSPDA